MIMKKLIAVALIAALLAGCGQPQTINGKQYETYGFLNSDSYKHDNICYQVSVGNVVWSILLVSTIVAPVYFVGFSIFNPVKAKDENGCKL
jgi:hypothetical protein